MAVSSKKSLISVVIPTLNSARVLAKCLESIRQQKSDYKFEIIIADGGSHDNTLQIAKRYDCKIYPNPLKTAEAGKAVGVIHSTGDYIALIDSDNILPTSNWFKMMMMPLENHPLLIGSEPWKYTYRRRGGFIERYSALVGVNDPYALITNVYDRKNYLRPGWTGLKIPSEIHNNYLIVSLFPEHNIPTIGANGTIFRAGFLKKNLKSSYLFDIDIISSYLNTQKEPVLFAKVKIGIIHTFCESSIIKFYRKQKRRITDLYLYQNLRTYNWGKINRFGAIKYCLYTITIVPCIIDSIIGYVRKNDLAWLFHPLACWITLYVYALLTFKQQIGKLRPINRIQWQQ